VTVEITGATCLAGVVGNPIRHSLSPHIHNRWLARSDLDAVYVAFSPPRTRFAAFTDGLRGGVVKGLNVTAPFKAEALALADRRSHRADRAGSANTLIFHEDGTVEADNTDGQGLVAAFRAQAPELDLGQAPVVILGAGGAARGAIAGLLDAGAPEIRIVNRDRRRADELAAIFGDQCRTWDAAHLAPALAEARAVINATPLGSGSGPSWPIPWGAVDRGCVVMDMVYSPLMTPLLAEARSQGHGIVDGLAMLIGQARPSYLAFFGIEPPDVDVRSSALAVLRERA